MECGVSWTSSYVTLKENRCQAPLSQLLLRVSVHIPSMEREVVPKNATSVRPRHANCKQKNEKHRAKASSESLYLQWALRIYVQLLGWWRAPWRRFGPINFGWHSVSISFAQPFQLANTVDTIFVARLMIDSMRVGSSGVLSWQWSVNVSHCVSPEDQRLRCIFTS